MTVTLALFIFFGSVFTVALGGLVLLWAQSKGWNVPLLPWLLVLDVDHLHWLTRQEPRLTRAVHDIQALLRPHFPQIPPVRAFVLNTMGYRTRDVMFGLIRNGPIRADAHARPTLFFIPDYRFDDCDDADLRIFVAHEYGHIVQIYDPMNPFVKKIGRRGEAFCHAVTAELYCIEQTMITLKKFDTDTFCQMKKQKKS